MTNTYNSTRTQMAKQFVEKAFKDCPRGEYIKKLIKFLTVKHREDPVVYNIEPLGGEKLLSLAWVIKGICYTIHIPHVYYVGGKDEWRSNNKDAIVISVYYHIPGADLRVFPVNESGEFTYRVEDTDKVPAFTPWFTGPATGADLVKILNCEFHNSYQVVERVWLVPQNLESSPEIFGGLPEFIDYWLGQVRCEQSRKLEERRRQELRKAKEKYAELSKLLED